MMSNIIMPLHADDRTANSKRNIILIMDPNSDSGLTTTSKANTTENGQPFITGLRIAKTYSPVFRQP